MRLAEIALVGLERVGEVPDDATAPLVGHLPPTTSERTLLLRLGVAAVRARAGRRPGQGARPEPAAAETRPPCSEELARIVVEQCRQRELVLVKEALTRMDERGMRLPPWCLVELAELKQRSLQPFAARVAGERGRWLAAQNPEWSWLLEGEVAESPPQRRRTWEEGSLAGRLQALRTTRTDNAAEARAWVEGVWKEEKAAVREELLAVLERGLSLEDEAFLERALTDRAAPVRAAAGRMLARLEGAALAQRMRLRAEALLQYRGPGSVGGLLGALKARLGGQDAAGSLEVTPPSGFAADWASDGLVEKPPAGKGEKAFWMAQVLSLVPPDHWARRFDVSPDVLVAAAAKSDWAAAVIGGWVEAAVSFRSGAWAAALWRGHTRHEALAQELPAVAARLLPLVSKEEAESLVAPVIAAGSPVMFWPLLSALTGPWGGALADTFIQAVERALRVPAPSWQETYAWKTALERAAVALPPACFARALALCDHGSEDPGASQLRNALDELRSIVSIRQRIHEETRP